MSSSILKMVGLVIIFDNLQVSGFGIMRSVGAQKISLVFAIGGYYVVACSIGYVLLFKTSLGLIGILKSKVFL